MFDREAAKRLREVMAKKAEKERILNLIQEERSRKNERERLKELAQQKRQSPSTTIKDLPGRRRTIRSSSESIANTLSKAEKSAEAEKSADSPVGRVTFAESTNTPLAGGSRAHIECAESICTLHTESKKIDSAAEHAVPRYALARWNWNSDRNGPNVLKSLRNFQKKHESPARYL